MSFSCVLAILPQSVETKKIKGTRCQQKDVSAEDQACLHHAFAIKFRFVSELHKESKISAGARAFSQRAIDITFHFVSLLWHFSISCPCFGPHQMEGKEPKVSIYPQRERATRRPKSPLGARNIFVTLLRSSPSGGKGTEGQHLPREREREAQGDQSLRCGSCLFAARI